MALLAWQSGIVTRIEDEALDTKRFWISVPNLAVFDFMPGQFVTLDLPIHEKPNKRWRSYSIASAPRESNEFELLIVRDELGAGTAYLFSEVMVGSMISFRGPQGVFMLKEPISQDHLLICTGAGIAPFRSMVHHLHQQGKDHPPIYLIVGYETTAELLYHEELQQLQDTMPGFSYIPVLTQENWEGRKGSVHEVYEELCINRQPMQFYLCGWRPMIDEARKRIAALGYDKKAIHFELYG